MDWGSPWQLNLSLLGTKSWHEHRITRSRKFNYRLLVFRGRGGGLQALRSSACILCVLLGSSYSALRLGPLLSRVATQVPLHVFSTANSRSFQPEWVEVLIQASRISRSPCRKLCPTPSLTLIITSCFLPFRIPSTPAFLRNPPTSPPATA
jgi:hypothetical protein